MDKKVLSNNKGQALVEFALILPLLLLLLLGVFEFGRIFSAGLIVNHSAREGARLGAVGAVDAHILARVQSSAVGLDPALLVVGITPGEAARERGEELTVSVEYPVAIVTPLIAAFTGDTVTVRGLSTMRVE